MVYDHQLSYAYSATTLDEVYMNGADANKKYLGVAPMMHSEFYWNEIWFDKLDHNKEEVLQASALFSGENLLDIPSTKIQFMEMAPDYGLIHCATHDMWPITRMVIFLSLYLVRNLQISSIPKIFTPWISMQIWLC